MTNRATRPTRLGAALSLALLLAALWVTLGLTAPNASGVAAKVIGQTRETPKPLCPDDCQATGTVTGFQVSAEGEDSLFKVPSDGHIVAWSVDLSKPEASQVASFNEQFKEGRFDGRAAARIGILKAKKGGRYKLTKQSPPVELAENFGSRPIFTLKKSLRVQKGQRIALTLPSWAPLYVNGVGDGNQWIASRKSDECEVDQLLEARPHEEKGSIRTYGCRFSGERLLYWAYFVPAGG